MFSWKCMSSLSPFYMQLFSPRSTHIWNRLLKAGIGTKILSQNPGTESLLVVIPDCSGFHYNQEYSWWSQSSCIKAAETRSRYFLSLHNGWQVIGNIKSARKNIDIDFQVWYKEMLDLSEKLGIVEAIPRKTSIQRNRSNIPSSSPIDHYKKSVAIPLLDSMIM